MANSAYIHIPFCSHKCDFCDFAAFAGADHLEPLYFQVLENEIDARLSARRFDGRLSTVYYGGGTPGLAEPGRLAAVQAKLSELAGCEPDAEVTLETTPEAVSDRKLALWSELGVNRLSVGIQSLDDRELQAIGRGHSRHEALLAVDRALAAGVANLSCDLMYGLPGQTARSWQATLETLLALPIQHLSAYGLMLESNSPLLLRLPRQSGAYPGEEQFVNFYDILVDTAAQAGFRHYEVSNFARPGFESRHNLNYWKNGEYHAFGVSAHRYIDGVRSANRRSLMRYMDDCLGLDFADEIDGRTRANEGILLGLRMTAGIDLDEFMASYGVDLLERSGPSIARMAEAGVLVLEGRRLRLSRRGLLVSNTVIAELIEAAPD